MELFLNLTWVVLALPACWLWLSTRRGQGQRDFSSLQCLLVLGSVLVLLFPVVSATDDLLAMRTEIEEPAPGKRAVRSAAADRCSLCNSRFQGPAILPPTTAFFVPENERFLTPNRVVLSVQSALPALCGTRAPPGSRLA